MTLSRSFLFGYLAKHNSGLGPTLAALLVLTASPVASAEWIGDARPMMGTEVSVYLWSDDPEAGRRALAAVFAEADRIDRLMSTYKDGSEISKINREAADAPVAAGQELFSLVQRALDVSVLTRGAFDITFDSVGQHYDFRAGTRPDAETVEDERRFINYQLVKLDKTSSTIFFAEEGVRINLGGIAKGYVVERGFEILRKHGIGQGVVTAGGDSRLLGDRRGRPWLVAIRDPRGEGAAMHLPLSDEAISTSGDYERYFEEDGVRYHHIIEPGSGEPAGGVNSATVIGPDAVITDALSTSVFVMGVDAGLKLIGTLPDYESVVIDARGRIFYSDGLAPPAP
ncbi:MAG: FAD:protein FMN transferase [Gammaproteobacteria bacterium]|nr:FAD:protein FMN transferase [Gammaproteobacteria bacterium]MBT8094425.1 FAD:protein FMN transferase [Gammaproteobacteria bacterium]NNF50422.1 FAD:protein FMN transferase [Woeseiaceae bacterium]NNL64305.1 FAD:protein FMN transferase [Woeseiaceae bacterium]